MKLSANIKLTKKTFIAAMGFYHPIDEVGRQLPLFGQVVCDATLFLQLYRVGKRDTGNPCPKPTGIDANQNMPLVAVVVILPVKFFAEGEGGLVLVRVHRHDSIGEPPGQVKAFKERKDVR